MLSASKRVTVMPFSITNIVKAAIESPQRVVCLLTGHPPFVTAQKKLFGLLFFLGLLERLTCCRGASAPVTKQDRGCR